MHENKLNEWKTYFDNVGLSNDFKEAYLKYISKLLGNKVPIIFEYRHLSLLLGCNFNYLNKIINCPEKFYRNFSIKKKSGGEREITAPLPSIMNIQYWIYENILTNVKIHKCAHGFTNKKSIITNARLHSGENQLLKIDLKDFFTSIKINRVVSIFKHLGYASNVAFYLAALCCYNEYLPQGAPTSPILSNIVSYKLDNRLFNLAQKFNLKYSRYADDLIFSGDIIPVKFIHYVDEIIKNEGFEINNTKTRLYKNKTKRIVTGISVLKNELKIPRDYKRDLKLELNYILKFGIDSHLKKKKIRNYKYLTSIIGKVNFWLSVEPNNEYAQKAKNHLIEIYKTRNNI